MFASTYLQKENISIAIRGASTRWMEICSTITYHKIKNTYRHSRSEHPLNGNMSYHYMPTEIKKYLHSRSEHPLNGNMCYYYIPENQKCISPFAERAPVEWKYVHDYIQRNQKYISPFAERAPVEWKFWMHIDIRGATTRWRQICPTTTYQNTSKCISPFAGRAPVEWKHVLQFHTQKIQNAYRVAIQFWDALNISYDFGKVSTSMFHSFRESPRSAKNQHRTRHKTNSSKHDAPNCNSHNAVNRQRTLSPNGTCSKWGAAVSRRMAYSITWISTCILFWLLGTPQ